jgi:uncharacterized tellurite resistance protein B-like protein
MDTNDKIRICKVVSHAILSDLQVTDAERTFINELMAKYGLSDEQKKDVMARNFDEDPAELVAGISGFDNTNALVVELIMAVAADGELSKTERQILDRVATAIGVDPADMDMLVKNALM